MKKRETAILEMLTPENKIEVALFLKSSVFLKSQFERTWMHWSVRELLNKNMVLLCFVAQMILTDVLHTIMKRNVKLKKKLPNWFLTVTLL